MNNYMYFIIGLVMGFAISLYLYISREEKIERQIALNKRIFSSKKLEDALENATIIIGKNIEEKQKELTEEEKDEIFSNCLKQKLHM